MSIEVANEKAVYLEQLAKNLNTESLKLLAELSRTNNIDLKIKKNAGLIKVKLAIS